MLRVVYEGTEAVTAFGLTLVFWLLLAPPPTRPWRRYLLLGVACGAAALVRPSFALVWVPAAGVVAWQLRPEGGRAVRRATALVALPAVVLIGSLSLYNGVRFDSFGLTPLLPYHLNSRTSEYIEQLPTSYEPARSLLIEQRDSATPTR